MYGHHAPFACGGPPWARGGGPPWARGHGRFGPRGGHCGPPSHPNREEWLSALEEHQKDLEQQVADIADLIRRLKDEEPEAEPAE